MAIENVSQKIENIFEEAKQAIDKSPDLERLEKARVQYLGRKSELSKLTKQLPELANGAMRIHVGQRLNLVKSSLDELMNEKVKKLKKEFTNTKIQNEEIDVTIPGRGRFLGRLHPLTKIERRAEDIFKSMGFSIVLGNEIETEYYNFDALNIPKDHPARDMQDTFWLKTKIPNSKSQISKNRLLLRTHTSPMQVRYMEKRNPPFKIVVPGRVYRHEATDASHEAQFHQIEGLMVGDDISLANLKGILEEFFNKFFDKKKVEVRFRPGYFPFVEPGVEADIKIGTGKWLEIAGAGMVHPEVFKSAKYIPGRQQGFAFGMGLDRLTMIYYGINDIRLFYSNDLRFLRQF